MAKVKTFFILFFILITQSIVSQENLINRKAVAPDLPVTPTVTDIPSSFPETGGRDGSGSVGEMSARDIWEKSLEETKPTGVEQIPSSSFRTGDEYTETRPNTDYERMAEIQQEAEFNKKRNAIIALIIISTLLFFLYKDYNEYFTQTSKKIIANIAKNKTLSNTNETDRIIHELERIQKLKEAGIINEVEFETLKKNILT